jgi:hypothetical protein
MLIVTFAIFTLYSSRKHVITLLRRLHRDRASSTLPRHNVSDDQPRHIKTPSMSLHSFATFTVWQLRQTAIVPKAKVCALDGARALSLTSLVSSPGSRTAWLVSFLV